MCFKDRQAMLIDRYKHRSRIDQLSWISREIKIAHGFIEHNQLKENIKIKIHAYQ